MPSGISSTAARWQNICNGYNKIWYTKSALRWLPIIAGAVSLMIFGAAWAQHMASTGDQLGIFGLMVLAPLFSMSVNAFAILLLFLLRRDIHINPGWLLSFDLLGGLLQAAVQGMFGPGWLTWNVTYWQSDRVILAAWGLNVTIGFFHLATFIIDIYEVHIHRRLVRERRKSGTKDKNMDFDELDDNSRLPLGGRRGDVELGALQSRAELDNAHLTELPDHGRAELAGHGRVAEVLPVYAAGPSNVGSSILPSDSKGRMMDNTLHVRTDISESPASSQNALGRSPVSALSLT